MSEYKFKGVSKRTIDILEQYVENMYSFKCPECGEKHNISDAVVMKHLISSKYAGMKFKPGRKIEYTYKEKYCFIRYCPKCAKSIKKNEKIYAWIVFVIIPIAAGVWGLIDAGIDGLILSLVAALIFIVVLNGLVRYCREGVNLEHMEECNAIENPFSDEAQEAPERLL